MSATNLKTQPVNFIRFHGLTLLVVEQGGIEYVSAKALSDLVGLAWRKTRETVQSGDNLHLYGTARLTPPDFDVLQDPRGLKTPDSGGGDDRSVTENTSTNGVLYIRLDRARMFLARVNTTQMRVQGNATAADTLLALQIEWAEALHAYETNGVAVKKASREARADLQGLFKTRTLAESPQEKLAITRLIAVAFSELGEPLGVDPQGSLDLSRP